MDVFYLFDSFNDKQCEVVVVLCINMLVLVGVGSGKMCVLVYCIVWLLSVENCFLYFIMVVIFINKVVVEMCYCIGQLMGIIQGGMWVGIFYGLVYCLLCVYYLDVNLLQDF